MLLETWIAFAVASTALLIVPGPTVMIVVSYALSRGRPSAWATVPGAVLGDFTAMTLSLIGAGAILAASAALFHRFEIIGCGVPDMAWHSALAGQPLGEKDFRRSTRVQ